MSHDLFSPLEIRGVRLKNRVVASPMWQYSGVDGAPTDTHAVHLGRLAEGGAGLIFQEGTTVARKGRGTVGDLGIWDDSLVPHYARLVDLVKAGGAVPGIQLIHAGRKGRRNPPWAWREPNPPAAEDWQVLGPSPLPVMLDGYNMPIEMSLRDIQEAVDAWVQAARRAQEAGYDVLEVQAAHGYLIHTFLSPLSNQRTDDYGGSPENRARLLMEIIDGIRTVWPADKPLFVRLSCVDVDWEIDQTVELVRELRGHEVDVIDCSSGSLTGRPVFDTASAGYGYQVPYAEEVRHVPGSGRWRSGTSCTPSRPRRSSNRAGRISSHWAASCSTTRTGPWTPPESSACPIRTRRRRPASPTGSPSATAVSRDSRPPPRGPADATAAGGSGG